MTMRKLNSNEFSSDIMKVSGIKVKKNTQTISKNNRKTKKNPSHTKQKNKTKQKARTFSEVEEP